MSSTCMAFRRKRCLSPCSAACFGSPYVLTLQTGGHDEPAAARSQGRLAAWAYGAADRYLSVSPGLSAAYRAAALPADRLRQVCNAVDVERFRPPRPGERDETRGTTRAAPRPMPDSVRRLFRPGQAAGLVVRCVVRACLAPARSRSHLVFVGRTDAAHGEVDARLAPDIRVQVAALGSGARRCLSSNRRWKSSATSAPATCMCCRRFVRDCRLRFSKRWRAACRALPRRLPGRPIRCSKTAVPAGWSPPTTASALTAALEALMADDEERRRCGGGGARPDRVEIRHRCDGAALARRVHRAGAARVTVAGQPGARQVALAANRLRSTSPSC